VAHAVTLAAAAAISLVGAGFGVHLGRATVAEIDPVYYSTPVSNRFFADLSALPYRAETSSGLQPADFWMNEFDAGGPRGCRDCPSAYAAPIYASASWSDEGEPLAYVYTEPEPEPEVRELEAGELQRYMTFPVTEAEAQEATRQEEEAVPADAFADADKDWDEPAPSGM
jgi:hypothetical protein